MVNRIGHYELIADLGRGAMGKVYRARVHVSAVGVEGIIYVVGGQYQSGSTISNVEMYVPD